MSGFASSSCPMGISVVVPTFNRREALLRAVHSVETLFPMKAEVVVVDDASAIDPREFLPAINRHGVRVRCFRLPRNAGPQSARNLGIRRAHFRFVAFLDSDDTFLAGKIDALLSALQQDNVDLLFHDCAGMQTSQLLSRFWARHQRWLPLPWMLSIVNVIPTPTLTVRRLCRLGVPGRRHAEDWAFLLHYCRPDTRALYLPLTLTVVDRPQGTAGGLSHARWRMRLGEFAAHRLLLRQRTLARVLRCGLGVSVSILRVCTDLLRGCYALRRRQP